MEGDVNLEDVKKSHYILKDLKRLGLKLDFSQDELFVIQSRETGKDLCTYYGVEKVQAFIDGFEVAKDL